MWLSGEEDSVLAIEVLHNVWCGECVLEGININLITYFEFSPLLIKSNEAYGDPYRLFLEKREK